MGEARQRLRSLSVNDETCVENVLGIYLENSEASGLDRKTYALVRLAALLALDSASPTYQWIVHQATLAGATVDEIVGTLVAVAPSIGVGRVVSAAPELAMALGYDVDAALEEFDDDNAPPEP
jgi:alkylhydroperoxidase/carboxymuconolactone decarboxylase family protein YurZ